MKDVEVMEVSLYGYGGYIKVLRRHIRLTLSTLSIESTGHVFV